MPSTFQQQDDLKKLDRAYTLIVANDYLGARQLLLDIVANTPSAYEKISKRDNKIYFDYWYEEELEAFLTYYGSHGGCHEVVGTQSVYPKALYHLAYIEIEDKNYEQALKYLEKLLEIEPDQPNTYMEIACIAVINKEHTEAFALKMKALTIRPYCSPILKSKILRGLGVSAIDLGNLKEAEAYLLEAQILDPENQLTLHELNYIKSLGKGAPRVEVGIVPSGQMLTPQIPVCCNCGKRLLIGKDQYRIVQKKDVNQYFCKECDERFSYVEELQKKAEQDLHAGDFALAIVEYSKILEIFPDDARTLSNRGMCYNYCRKYARAIVDCSRAIELFPDTLFSYFNRGIALFESGSIQEALADFTKTTQLSPNHVEAFVWRGICYSSQLDFEAAISDYSKAISLKPNLTGAIYNRAQAYFDNEQADKALIDVNHLVMLDPTYAKGQFLKGKICDVLGLKEEAIEHVERATSLEPENRYYLSFLAVLCNKFDKSEQAIKILTRLIEWDSNVPPPPEVFQERGVAYMAMGQYNEALFDLEHAGTLLDTPYLHANIGNVCFQLDKMEKAVEQYTLVIQQDPDNIDTYNNRAKAYEMMGKHEEAIQDLTVVILKDPLDCDVLFRRADCYNCIGRHEEAVIDYTKVIEIEPAFVQAYLGLACSSDNLGEGERALGVMLQLISVIPESALPHLMMAALLADNNRLDEATAELDIGIAKEPENPGIESARNIIMSKSTN